MVRSQSCGAMSSIFAVGPAIPALFTSTSSPLSSCFTSAKSRSTSASFDTSATDCDACSFLRHRASACSSISQICTRAPCSTKVAAIARPMPAAPAVTSTLNPSTRSDVVIAAPGFRSYPKDGLAECKVGEERLGGAGVGHAAAVEDVGAVGQREHQVEVVLDDEDRDLAAQLVQRFEHLLYH